MKAAKLAAISVLIAGGFAMSGAAHAGGLFGDIARGLGNAIGGNAGQAVKDAANAGDDASRQIQRGNVGGAVQSAGQVIVNGGRVPGAAITDLGRASGNRDIANAARSVASVVTINSDALGTATIISGNVLAGQDPRQVYAAPLAAAIRHARNAHMVGARRIPQEIQDALRGTIPEHILRKARYTEGELEISVANVINQGHRRLLGDDHAVTVDDLIVFSEVPSSDPDDEEALNWWAHELAHVWQYSKWGVERFAQLYIDSYSRVEEEAEELATLAVERYTE